MGSSAVAGYKSFVQVSQDNGVTWADISEQKSATLRFSTDKIEVTNKTTSPMASGMIMKERVQIAADWSATVDANLVDDTLQRTLTAAALAGTIYVYRFCRVKQAGQPTMYGSGVIEFSENMPLTDAATVQYTITAAAGTVMTVGTY